MSKQLTRRDFLRVTGGGFAGAALLGAYGCGGGDEQGSQEGGQITLNWWDYWTEGATNEAIKERLARYSENNPNVTIERRNIPFDQLKPTLTRAANAGNFPDIAVIDNPDHASFAQLGVLLDVSNRVDEWDVSSEAYFDGPWRSCQYNGTSYGIPNSSNCLALFYNTDMLQAQGVQPPANWAELRDAAEQLTTQDRFGLAVSAINSEEGTFQWLPFLWQSGADIPNLDGSGGREALQLWVDLVNQGYMSSGILNWRQADVKNEFVNQRAAMMINGPWQIPVINEDHPDLNWDVAVLPEGEESASILGGENMAISAQSQNADAAWDLLTWTQQPDNLVRYLEKVDRLPSRQDLADRPVWAEDPILSVFVEQLLVARPRAYGADYPEISSHIQTAIQAAISGESDVEGALSRAQEEINPLLPERMRQ